MDQRQVIIDFAIPVLMMIIGAFIMRNPNRMLMTVLGHRTRRSRQSDEAWDYANRRLGDFWKKLGALLFLLIGLSYFINPLEGSDLHSFNTVVGIVFLFMPSILVERDLKKKFGDPDIKRESVQGLRDNKKRQKEQEIKQQYKKEKQKEKEKKKEQKNREKSK